MSNIELAQVLQPIAKAKGLPNAHYIDARTHEWEREKLFFDQWAAIGFTKDLPDENYVKPIEFLKLPLLLVRDQENEVRVFQNTCRHRGMILVDTKGPLKGAIRCPYHSWCYSASGKLVSTPHVGGPGNNIDPNIIREELGLIEIRSHIWKGIIFVNVNKNAAPFEEENGELLRRWHEFEKPIHHTGEDSSFKLKVNCNWKLAVENYCESYHLPWIHPGLNAYSRLEDHYHIMGKSNFSGQGTNVYNPKLSDNGRNFENFEGLSAKWNLSAEYISLFPNLLLGMQRDHIFAIILQPVDQENTIEHIEIYYAQKSATASKMQEMRKKNADQWREIFEEDIFVVEGMQRGRQAVKFDGGKFSPVMDEPTHAFHHWVASQLTA